ncbi:hypothetical protein HQ865_25040 [Mucilaginibacter mali]|uniref:Wadjet protein JetD C-terminal domain-containing protein n=1 Tax=Mucilaginibacter mali TaxID=2740462 RepID=A0A7D4UPA0_9SPHI|nr:Wadjet anti-phage system protein JetD domain-containing protein [Mucilaginibacter mali]QKJ32881.1 hypothetical protein HQ865_25040 [Mucilaginibacter mali]
MITTAEIRKKAEKLYPSVLRSVLTGEGFFPVTLRSDKSLSKDFSAMSREIAHIMSDSKDRKGFGYQVVSEKVKHRQHGIQDIPKAIVFETLADYIKYIGKQHEFDAFKADADRILNSIPQLKDWCSSNPLMVVANNKSWEDLVKVCLWFISFHETGKYYIRELPIEIHTKFIESHLGVLRLLLDELIPHLSKREETFFQKRFGLKHEEPRIRIRILDPSLIIDNRFSDISLPLSDFSNANFICRNVLITENLMNFLTLPKLKNTIAIWGGGYAVKNLQLIEWMVNKHIYYWGDIDIQGFEILSMLRGYYEQTVSLMMDEITFNKFNHYHGTGSVSNVWGLNHLTISEHNLYLRVYAENQRLEQEKIPQGYVNEILRHLDN